MKFSPAERGIDYFTDRMLVDIYLWIAAHEHNPEWSDGCALVRLALGSGLRVAEIADLRVEDCAPAEGFVHVRHGKRDKARYVRVIPEYEPFLADRCSLLRYGPMFPIRGPKGRGGHPTTRTLQRLWESILVEIHNDTDGAVPYLSIHKARHTFATHELAWGRMTPTVIQAQLGHSSIDITHAHYLHAPLESLFRERAEWWGAALPKWDHKIRRIR
jgi:integrase